MSTAIALQDIRPDSTTIHHRTHSKPSPTQISETQQHDPWLSTLHDAPCSPTQPFTPTHTYWITPHGLLSKTITILNLTPDLPTPHPALTPSHKAAIQSALKDHAPTPTWTCHRNTWLGLRYTITDAQHHAVAEWTHPWASVGAATLTFAAPPAPAGMHTLTLRPKTWGLRSEAFVLGSVPYVWEMDSRWHSTHMTLYRVFGEGEGQRREAVARYAEKWWGGVITGGAVVVEEKEAGMGMVACLSAVVVLKKKRQRAVERRSGGE